MVLGALSSSGGSPAWTQKVILGQLQTMFFMPLVMSLIIPQAVAPGQYQEELDELTRGYKDMTGQGVQSEEIWALSGVYTQYGTGQDDKPSQKYGITDDGWIFGQRITDYNPFQYHVDKDEKGKYIPYISGVDYGKLGYVVQYNSEKKLYYYSWHGEDLLDIENSESDNLGTLYTRVHMDTTHKSSIFITTGGKHAMDNGTFYYEFDGYRYSFVPLQDYNYDRDTGIKAKNSSCSLIWYQYSSDSGIAGQIVISGTDAGIQYITGASIVRQFDQQTNTAKFTMSFNGVDVYIYIQLDPYALNTMGLTPEACYNQGYFSIMVTTPKYVSQGGGGHQITFDSEHMWDTIIGLFTFSPERYGLQEGSLTGQLASVIFILPFYTQLFALGPIFWPLILISGQIQAITHFHIF